MVMRSRTMLGSKATVAPTPITQPDSSDPSTTLVFIQYHLFMLSASSVGETM